MIPKMSMCGALCVCLAALGGAVEESRKAPLPSELLSAKTVYLQNEAGDPKLMDAIYAALTKWGRFEVVADREKADLVVVISGREVFGSLTTASATGNVQGTYASGIGSSVPIPYRTYYMGIYSAHTKELVWSDRQDAWLTASQTANRIIGRLKKRLTAK
jgi:hypothetical protein